MKIFLLVLFICFLIPTILAFEVICVGEDRVSGVRVWNYNQTLNDTMWALEDIENEEGLNCTAFETNITRLNECEDFSGPIVHMLNSNIKEKDAKIKEQSNLIRRQNWYKYFAFIFMALTIFFIFWIKFTGGKNGTRKKRKAEG